MKITVTQYTYDDSNKVFHELYMVDQNKVVGRAKTKNTDSILGMKGMILEILNVDVNHARKGVGNALVKATEKTMKQLGAEFCILYCRKDSWMKEWYERLGYKYHMPYNDKNDWMFKLLK